MKEKRETFYEDYLFFRKNCSSWKLFIKPKQKGFASKHSGKLVIFGFLQLIALIPLTFLDSLWIVFTTIASILLTFLIAFFMDSLEIRRQLKNKGLPLPPIYHLFKWSTEDLENIRVRKVYKKYKGVHTDLISERISYAEHLMEKHSRIPDSNITKIIEFFAKQYFLVTIGVLLFIYKSEEDYLKSLSSFFIWFSILLVFCLIIALVWNRIIMNPKMKKSIEIKLLDDYVSVLKNVLLMRSAKKTK